MRYILDILNYEIINTGGYHVTILKLIVAIISILTAIILINFIHYLLKKKIKDKNIETKAKFRTLFNILKYFSYFVVGLILLSSFGFNINLLLTGSAALFVGIGMGMQQFFMDFIAGIIILFDNTLAVGDIIQLEDQVGKIERINFRTTQMITRDERVVIIPNHKFLSEYLNNWTQNSVITRFNLDVSVAYGSDTQLVKKILIETALENMDVEKTPTPFVIFEDFGESSLAFKLYFFTAKPLEAPGVKSNLRFMIDEQFRKNNIIIPFPQRDIHIINPSSK